jgi:hypothetical protein
VVHQAEATKAMEAQQKVSMTTDLEATIITSFSTILLSILVVGQLLSVIVVLPYPLTWML